MLAGSIARHLWIALLLSTSTFCSLHAQEVGVDATQMLETAQQTSSDAPPSTTKILSSVETPDSTSVQQALVVADELVNTWKPNPKKALLWALIPGGGQIYNRKYWKLPIVWGALATCAYFIDFNGRQYEEYHAAYRDIKSSDPSVNTSWLAFAPEGTKPEDYAKFTSLASTLERGNDYYRRYRDLSIVLAIGVYGLSILDAYVDAELFTFDISPDLSMSVMPNITPPIGHLPSQVGMVCQLTF